MISFVSLIVYLRLLSAADFGLFSAALALVELLGVLVTMLFHNALVQRPDVTDLHFNTAFTATMALSLLMALGCWAMAPLFAAMHQAGAARVLIWLGLIFPCSAVSATLVARQRRHFDFRALALRSLVGRSWAVPSASRRHFGSRTLEPGSSADPDCRHRLIRALGGLRQDSPSAVSLREFKHLIGFGALSVGALFLSSSLRRVFTILASSLSASRPRVTSILASASSMCFGQSRPRPLHSGSSVVGGTAIRPSPLQAGIPGVYTILLPCSLPLFRGIGRVAPDIVEVLFGHRWHASSPYVTVLGFLVLLQVPRLLVTPVLTALGSPETLLSAWFPNSFSCWASAGGSGWNRCPGRSPYGLPANASWRRCQAGC